MQTQKQCPLSSGSRVGETHEHVGIARSASPAPICMQGAWEPGATCKPRSTPSQGPHSWARGGGSLRNRKWRATCPSLCARGARDSNTTRHPGSPHHHHHPLVQGQHANGGHAGIGRGATQSHFLAEGMCPYCKLT